MEDFVHGELLKGLKRKANHEHFRSSGVHDMTEYKPPSKSETLSPAPTRSSRIITKSILESVVLLDEENVGYQLLRKAGWKEGAGLGAAQQGRVAPIMAHAQKGNRGIGWSGTSTKSSHQSPRQLPSNLGGSQGNSTTAVSSGAGAAAAAGRPGNSSSRIAQLVAGELREEPLEKKVKRHQQIQRQEEEDERGKAIQAYLFKAFSEPSIREQSDHVSPLLRPSRLTAFNPLLD